MDSPPAYAVSSLTHANPYHSQESTQCQYSRNTGEKRSKGHSALSAIKGIFSIGGKGPKGAKPQDGAASINITAATNQVNIQISAPGQAMQLQVPSAGQVSGQALFHTPGSEHLSNSSGSARHPSQPLIDAAAPEGYSKPLRRPTTLATEDQLEALRNYDTQFLIDDSGSMRLSTSQIGKGKTHWEEVNSVLSEIVKICAKFDDNGIDVFFFNSSLVGLFNGFDIKNPDEVMKLFEHRERAGIRGSTPTAEALDLIIAPYLSDYERRARNRQKLPKPRNIIVLTDGAANNNKLLKTNLLSYARRLDKINAPSDQIGVQFFQVGRMEGVEEFLNHLDEAMAEENDCRDFIDTRSSEDMGEEGLSAPRVLTTVLGAVNRRLDKKMT